MMRKLTVLLAGVLALSAISTPAIADRSWQEITAPQPDAHTMGPSCAGGLKFDEVADTVVPTDPQFSFFFREGDPRRLAIFFDGGGACWDVNTCIGSPQSGSSTYSQAVDETAAGLDALPGLAAIRNDNPIRDYTQVFIPYCTGDLHTGANDFAYVEGVPKIRHRGAINVRFVLDWLSQHLDAEPYEIFLSGASAGGYGVLYHYPAIAKRVPWYARTRVLVDAANGVINQDFYDRALAPEGAWNVWENLAPELQAAFASDPDEITIETFKSLAYAYPFARFGQYTTAFDATQIAFFNIARNIESPELWQNPEELAAAAFEWTLRARTYQILTALQTWNYRYYTAAGTDHTIVGDDKFYTENSAQGVFFRDWVDDMINRRWLWWNNDWRNVSCAPNCLQ